jgi:hypothetical protein
MMGLLATIFSAEAAFAGATTGRAAAVAARAIDVGAAAAAASTTTTTSGDSHAAGTVCHKQLMTNEQQHS